MKKSDFGDLTVRSVMFYPLELVEEIFTRMAAARDTPREAAELMIFYRRMKRLYDGFSAESNCYLDEDKTIEMAALGEAVEDAEFVAAITNET
jgi:hypothetical protein